MNCLAGRLKGLARDERRAVHPGAGTVLWDVLERRHFVGAVEEWGLGLVAAYGDAHTPRASRRTWQAIAPQAPFLAGPAGQFSSIFFSGRCHNRLDVIRVSYGIKNCSAELRGVSAQPPCGWFVLGYSRVLLFRSASLSFWISASDNLGRSIVRVSLLRVPLNSNGTW